MDSGTGPDYDVVLLVEEALTDDDAARVRSLHAELDQPVVYHVLLPADEAAARVEASLGSMAAPGDVTTYQSVPLPVDLDEVTEELRDRAQRELTDSVAALERAGATVAGSAVVSGAPVDELADRIAAVDGREAIVLTRPHVVASFFHVDWAAQARRRLGVPVLHLLEHETFDEQAYGE